MPIRVNNAGLDRAIVQLSMRQLRMHRVSNLDEVSYGQSASSHIKHRLSSLLSGYLSESLDQMARMQTGRTVLGFTKCGM